MVSQEIMSKLTLSCTFVLSTFPGWKGQKGSEAIREKGCISWAKKGDEIKGVCFQPKYYYGSQGPGGNLMDPRWWP